MTYNLNSKFCLKLSKWTTLEKMCNHENNNFNQNIFIQAMKTHFQYFSFYRKIPLHAT